VARALWLRSSTSRSEVEVEIVGREFDLVIGFAVLHSMRSLDEVAPRAKYNSRHEAAAETLVRLLRTFGGYSLQSTLRSLAQVADRLSPVLSMLSKSYLHDTPASSFHRITI
jgi:hypothetical protein